MSKEIYSLLERMANLLRQESRQAGLALGLQPIQQEALWYLSICNHYSDTPVGVTEYLGLTKGTVSQSLKVLEKKGLVKKTADKKDKRITHLHLTQKGRRFIDTTCPPPIFNELFESSEINNKTAIESELKTLLGHYQHSMDRKLFGICKRCSYHQRTPDGPVCGLTKEPLAQGSIELICREYTDRKLEAQL